MAILLDMNNCKCVFKFRAKAFKFLVFKRKGKFWIRSGVCLVKYQDQLVILSW